jgi:DNA helicase II / ATP-dependent DNA helicase PcrA
MLDMRQILKQLNAEQRAAVEHIDGPLMVLAGPGTGKTQLLSARVANILATTDTLAQNILCLTFTEAGVRAMRERLTGMIGEAAYDVRISTYHGFGSEIIRAYPDFFYDVAIESGKDTRLEKPIDDLTKTQLLDEILQSLRYDDPLRSARYYVRDVASTISELKSNLIAPERLQEIAQENSEFITRSAAQVQDTFGSVGRIPSIAKALTVFESLGDVLAPYQQQLAMQAHQELHDALEQAASTQKTTVLTAWKNRWLERTADNRWQIAGQTSAQKMRSLASVYAAYNDALATRSLYDFDDMIVRCVAALQQQPELRASLQETYQYILLDEFQDTNAAQFALVKLIANHPVHEGRPNIMAVGDDDQAIYAFQGAHVGNMLDFIHAFSDVAVINLVQNYRSHKDILHVAHALGEQIESRLHHNMQGITKSLQAANSTLPPKAAIERHEFVGQANELSWIADRIATLLAAGTPADEIAVLAPKHALLEQVVSFLNDQNVAVHYEKRENILQTPIVQSLVHTARLLVAIQQRDSTLMDELFPVVLSLPHWRIPVQAIWQINWQYATKDESRSWAELALESELAKPVIFLLELAETARLAPLERTLDYITGLDALEISEGEVYASPLKEHYFSTAARNKSNLEFYEALSHISVIRSKLRNYQSDSDAMLSLDDFVSFINMYELAEQPLINTHPIAQASEAVQLLTVYKAKGLEFSHVFLLSMHDDVWGSRARSNINKLPLPHNLAHIRYRGSSEDELRRLLFVAVTRAKQGLYLTSYQTSESGKQSEPVKYLRERMAEDDQRESEILPAHNRQVVQNDYGHQVPSKQIELLWHSRHTALNPSLQSLLQDRLVSYKMNPTHLNTFVDMEYGGPEAFLLKTLLKFPSAPTADSEFGTAIHNTLDWLQKQAVRHGLPTFAQITQEFSRQLHSRYVPSSDFADLEERGKRALKAYVNQRPEMFTAQAISEVDFSHEGVLLEASAHLSGKIDRLEVDSTNRSLQIVDFKTGDALKAWGANTKSLKYQQQLLFYKLLIEGSHSYKGYRVESARLEFVEPDEQGRIAKPLYVTFDEQSIQALSDLILHVWQHIQQLNLPDTNAYPTTYQGTKQFIAKLLEA